MAFDLARLALEDPTMLDRIPNGATVMLLPDDDPSVTDDNIRDGIDAIAAGANVYFMHVRTLSHPE